MDFKLLLGTFLLVFFAELGDKTQLAALSLAAGHRGGIFSVFLGASLALVCTTGIACLCAGFLCKVVHPKYLNLGSAVLFILLGVASLVKFAWTSQDFNEPQKTEIIEVEQKE
ncbi:MAG: TMEM165/GDT1 family protein [Lentisphaeria bacterium]|jgi:putative Ca2+/H+ antiporter (TMEM165/GDT1 family)|nr:TMEM165/GDT1 family protein [Lentisphaerota bacterium]